MLYKSEIFELSFLPYFIKEWNNLSEELREKKSTVLFKTKILSVIRPKETQRHQATEPSQITF